MRHARPDARPETRVDPRWPHFTETVLRFRDHGRRVDLRRHLSRAERAWLRSLLDGTFAVVTAFNPTGAAEPFTRAANRARLESLRRELRAASLAFCRCDGASPDGAHVEEGFAVALDASRAEAIARDHRQAAYFFFDGDGFTLASTRSDEPPLALPLTATMRPSTRVGWQSG